LYRERRPVREIAAIIGRSPSTVSRELRRNADHDGRYLPRTADRLALVRVRRPRRRRLLVDVELRGVVTALLDKRWSPEQVAYELRERFPDQPHRQLSTETSTKRSTTPTCRSPDRPSVDVVDVAAACRGWNGAGG
jgi:transposase, IS30 family